VVKLLQQLGVHMVIDDMGTYDVHGQEMQSGKGWPEVVRPILQSVHTADYDYEELSYENRRFLDGEIGKMNAAHERKKRKGSAEYVDYGIKAPVSMLLVPAFHHIWGKMKFVHVVRDGRDISFSGNQSPVNKFYRNSYVDGDSKWNEWDVKVKAMQLWSDWNADLYEWEKRNSDGATFDFVLLRLEDLLEQETRYESMMRIAAFVGSTMEPKQVCCLSREGVKDMGSHGGGISDVKKRYGKWHEPLQRDPKLSKDIHEQGKKGLDAFGYESMENGGGRKKWMEENSVGDFVCDASVAC
jgi:hypothetical protein